MLHDIASQWLNDFAAQGILVTDAQLVIRQWGRWLETHSQRRADEMIGRPLFEAFPELITRGLSQYYYDALTGQVRFLSHRFHRYLLPLPPGDGDHAFAQMQQSARIAPLLQDGQVIGTITVIEDVTERVNREDRLMKLLVREQAAREEAEAANRAKDEFLATVSHELRTPLNAVYGWMQVLQRSDLEPISRVRGMEAIERNIKMLSRLIEDILDVSRIITGKFSLDVRPVDLVTLIEAALEAVRPAADAKKIELRAALDANAGPVAGDPHRLQQIVWNLLSNAIKFTPAGGRVEIQLKRLNSQAEIIVNDSGQGIPANFLPYVFERFRQADSTSARRHGGLGLGLAIVRHLVEMHGGTAQAASDGEGKGATFAVRLPLLAVQPALHRSSKRAAAQANSAEEASGSADANRQAGLSDMVRLDGIRVLVVDDDADARETLNIILAQCGAEVRVSASVPEALSLLQRWRPDVLVSDVGMPDEDGYTLINQVRALKPKPGWNIPAVALTGYAGAEDRSRLLAAGFQLHFSKPVGIQELANAVATLAEPAAKEAQTPVK
jgi:signal transduction histidine kinase/ActR/RegA family two-component response regulator